MSIRAAFEKQFGTRVRFDEPLAPYVFYRVGGPADILVFPRDETDLQWISNTAKRFSLPITTIGTGSNLLVRDEGIEGITVSLSQANKTIEILEQAATTLVRVGGGVEKPVLLDWAIQHNLGGLEFSAGVPGTIGGGIYMNAGTKYGCYGDILRQLRLFNFESGPEQYKREEIEFEYRKQSIITRDTLVLWVDFELTAGNTQEMKQEVDRIIAERAAKQPLDFPSCGSTFKNPEGFSAGRLIEKTGLKGTIKGGAQISEKHANFILNKNNATANDILFLIALIKDRVLQQFGVELECEVIVVGGRPQHHIKENVQKQKDSEHSLSSPSLSL